MRKLKLTIVSLVSLLILLFFGLYGYFYFATKTQQTGKLYLQGLHGEVTITRDQYGVPHIKAQKSDLDAFYALGFVQAQDRFWQMDIQRHIGEGSLSEYFGKTTLKKDEFLRTWGFYRAAKLAWPTFNKKGQAIINSYTAGVNAFLQRHHLPLQYKILNIKPRPWTNIDSLVWAKMMAFDLEDSWRRKIEYHLITQTLGASQVAVLLPHYPKGAPTILSQADLAQSNLLKKSMFHFVKRHAQYFLHSNLLKLERYTQSMRKKLGFANAPGKGSNNWVLAASRTTTKQPLLANDPHLGLQAPSIWYLAELQGPHLHVIGASLLGLPAIVLGHNDHIAWGVTNVDADTQDVYALPADAKITKRVVTIKVHDSKPVKYTVRMSRYGPIISDVIATHFKQPLALRWKVLQPGDTSLDTFVELDYAKNWQQFKHALSFFESPSQNFVYADTKGNIGYYLAGKIPIRQASCHEPDIVMPNEQCQWVGSIPFAQLPHVFNPPEQMLATANNKNVPNDYPYYITFRWHEPPYRIERIQHFLHAKQRLSIADMKTLQSDELNLFWPALKPYLLSVKPLDKRSNMALSLLKKWNGDMTRDSIATTIYAAWYRQLATMPNNKIHSKEYWKQPLFILSQLEKDGRYCHLTKDESCQAYLSHSLQMALNSLVKEYGADPLAWQWGKIHHAKFIEMALGTNKMIGWLWNRQISTGGGDYTVDPGSYRFKDFTQDHGASYRQIVDLGNFNKSLYITTPGESGNRFNRHYDDLMKKWRNGEYIPMSSSAKDWGRTTQLTLLPQPK